MRPRPAIHIMTQTACYIHHVTLQTGHVRQSWRHEIDHGLHEAIGEILADALRGDRQIQGDPAGCVIRATASSKCLLASVHSPEEAGSRLPLVTIGVAAHSRCGASIWRLLTEVPARIDAGPCPREPWCAARLETGLAVYPGAAHWLGDMERCLAWAWLDLVERRRAA